MIPFFDLTRQYKSIQAELRAAESAVFDSGKFIGGDQVELFEKNFSNYTGSQYCISCGSGSDALELVLKAWGIGPGDEVIVPAMTWISDAEAVYATGAKVVFADISKNTYCINPAEVRNKITAKTRAIIAVHLYGHPSPMDELQRIASEYNLLILEDCAHAHGALYKNQKTGTLGDAAIFSFYPTKNLGAYGDAGAVVTNNKALAEKIRLLTNHGQVSKNEHVLSGHTSRMDELQAAYLTLKLPYLVKWNSRRREIAAYYSHNLKNVIVPVHSDDVHHVFHQFVIQSEKRDALMVYLKKNGIGTAIHYPHPLPATKPFYEDGWKNKFPVAAALSRQALSLPIFPELSDDEVREVVKVVKAYFLNIF